MADVFISHAAEDRARVAAIASALEARGFSVWWDRAQIAADEYARTIERAMEDARTILVVWSERSATSPFVLNEAAQAKKSRRYVALRLDEAAPTGFAPEDILDFSAWQGKADATAFAQLEAALRAPRRLSKLRDLVTGRFRLAITVGAVVIVCLLVLMLVLSGQRDRQSEAPDAQFRQLVLRARTGALSGEQAVTLAGLLSEKAFASQANETARASFTGAAAQLLQFTDGDVRVAAIDSVAVNDRKPAVDLLWRTAEAQEMSAGAIYRFLGALGGDDRTRLALERALASDPFDRRMWFLLSEHMQRSGEGSAYVTAMAKALAADAEGRVDQTESLFADALAKAREPLVQAFILGRLGDGAALRNDWVAAEGYYKRATEILEKAKAYGLLTIEASRLARARQHQGKMDDACAALQRAEKAGAAPLAGQTKPLCPEGG